MQGVGHFCDGVGGGGAAYHAALMGKGGLVGVLLFLEKGFALGRECLPARRAPNMATGYHIVLREKSASVSPALKPWSSTSAVETAVDASFTCFQFRRSFVTAST